MAMIIRQEIDLSLTENLIPAVVHIRQYDSTAKQIACNIYVGGAAYTLPDDAVVSVSGTRPDGQLFQYGSDTDPDVVWIDGTQVIIAITDVMSNAAGRMAVDVTLTLDGAVAGTFAFVLRVQASSVENEAISTGSYSGAVEAVAAAIAEVYINEDGYLVIESEDGLNLTYSMDDEGNITIDYEGSSS